MFTPFPDRIPCFKTFRRIFCLALFSSAFRPVLPNILLFAQQRETSFCPVSPVPGHDVSFSPVAAVFHGPIHFDQDTPVTANHVLFGSPDKQRMPLFVSGCKPPASFPDPLFRGCPFPHGKGSDPVVDAFLQSCILHRCSSDPLRWSVRLCSPGNSTVWRKKTKTGGGKERQEARSNQMTVSIRRRFMAEKNQVYKCTMCGNIVEVLHGGTGSFC